MSKKNICARTKMAFSFAFLMALMTSCSDDSSTNTNNPAVNSIEKKTISGYSQKGPFVTGTSVTLQELDGESLAQTGKSFKGDISKDNGEFIISSVSLASPYALLEATGYFRNEITGKKSSGTITLNALTDLSQREKVNINVLTHLIRKRIYNLVSNGSTVADAKKQAETELFKNFGISGDFKPSEDLDIFHSNDGDAALLAISILLLHDLNDADFTDILSKIANDFEEDGKWDNSTAQTEIADWAFSADLKNIRNNIESWKLGDVPSFEKFISSYWMKNYGLGTCDSLHNGDIQKNSNKQSSNSQIVFKCKNKTWVEAKDSERDHVELWKDTTEWSFKKGNETGNIYIFENGKWREATAEESTAIKNISSSPADYSKGRAMNARLGRGINLGNSWESDGLDDAGWANPIRDTDFATIKDAGFNSVRIPVRWQNNSNYTTHTVDPNRLQGVMEDIRLAIEQGLAVVINFHHYTELNCAGGGGTDGSGKKCEYNEATFANEKAHFLGLWTQVATALNTFPDDMVVLEILNEPIIPNEKLVDELMNDAYTVIRKAAPGKTIMFESYHAAKFAELSILHLPVNEGNVIYSGHYYEPYAYTHQGHGYNCIGDKANVNTAAKDMKNYAKLAKLLYPDVNGVDHIPLNMGEFGVAGGEASMACIDSSPSNEGKAKWTQLTAQAAIDNSMSFHYWSFGRTAGFDAYNFNSESWYSGFPQALIPNKK